MIYILLGAAIIAILGFVGLFVYMQIDSYRSLVNKGKSAYKVKEALLAGHKDHSKDVSKINEEVEAAALISKLSRQIIKNVATKSSPIFTRIKI